ncbi:Hypothetical protein PHPALM_19535, partial [Phytophthora palmivora]
MAMNSTVGRSLCHVAEHTAHWQRLFTRSFASQAPSAATHSVNASDEDSDDLPPKATTSSKGFNLITAHSLASRGATQTSDPIPAAWNKAKKYKHRRKNKNNWWAHLCRVSFRTLPTEGLGSNEVPLVLGK